MAVIHVWDEFKRSDHGRTLWVKLDDAEARINKLEAEVAERESALEELSEMLAESYFFLMNPDHPSTVHKRAEIAALDESEGREDWRDYLREEAQQPYFGPNMQPPAWWSARREAEATAAELEAENKRLKLDLELSKPVYSRRHQAYIPKIEQRAEQAEATVERLTWMVRETWGQGGMEYGPPDFFEYMADLERRWQERQAE